MMRSLWCRLGLAVVFACVAFPVLAQQTPREARREGRQAARELRGKIVRTADDRVVIRTPEDKEVILYTSPKTRYLQGEKVIKFTELRPGTTITTSYVTEGDRYIADSFNLAAADEPVAEGTVVEGTVVRVIGQDQVVLRTPQNKEFIVYVSPKTTYTFENRSAAFTDIRTGAPLKVTYDVRDRRNMARTIISTPRR